MNKTDTAMAAFLDAVNDNWNKDYSDFVRLPLMSQRDSTMYFLRRGIEAALGAVEPEVCEHGYVKSHPILLWKDEGYDVVGRCGGADANVV